MVKSVCWLCLSLLLSGCASIYTQTHDAYTDAGVGCADGKTIPNIYSGLVFDIYCLPAENAGFFCLVDLPLSLVVDTVVVPYSAYRQVTYGSWYSQQDCLAREVGEPGQSGEAVAP